MSDFLDEVKYTLDGMHEVAQDSAHVLKNLPSIADRRGKIKKLCRYFTENLPERFTKSPQYEIDIVWDMGMFIGSITLDITEEGVDYTQVNHEEMRTQAKQIVAEILPSVSNPPFLIKVIFAVQYPNGRGYYQHMISSGKLPRTKGNS